MPPNFSGYFKNSYDIHNINTPFCGHLCINFTKTEIPCRLFLNTGARIWNCLDSTLNYAKPVLSFKSKPKSDLLRAYFIKGFQPFFLTLIVSLLLFISLFVCLLCFVHF